MERHRRLILTVCVLFNVAILFTVKYFNFFGENVNVLLNRLGIPAALPHLALIMPLGVSFYTLTAIGYLADVHLGKSKPEKNFARLLLFLIFFPAITEGPICRYEQLGKELAEPKYFDYKKFCFGLQLIIWGLFQKVVLADRLYRFVGVVFDDYIKLPAPTILLGILLYTFQIYMDFAGCIYIAMGSAELFGIQLPENFRQPFSSRSVSEFWRRWHITLGAWLRDYVFYPVSMSRWFMNLGRKSRNVFSMYYAAAVPSLFALLAVWMSNGIWHGAEWKYIVYGLYYYIILVLGTLLEPIFGKLLLFLHLTREQKGYQWFQRVRTFVLVNLGMAIFRADTLKDATNMITSLFVRRSEVQALIPSIFKNGLSRWDLLIIILGLLLVIFASNRQEHGEKLREWIAGQALLVRWGIYFVGIFSIILLGAYGAGYGAAGFIYAQF